MTPAGTSTSRTSTGPATRQTGARPTRKAGSTATDLPSPPRDLTDATVGPGTGQRPTPPYQAHRTSAQRLGRSVPAGPTAQTGRTCPTAQTARICRIARLAGTRATPGPRPMARRSPHLAGGQPLVADGGMACGRPARPSPGERNPDTCRRRIMTPPQALAPATSRHPTGRLFMTRRSMTSLSMSHPSMSHPAMSHPATNHRPDGSLSRLRVRRGRAQGDRE